jgi:hypothetical protein
LYHRRTADKLQGADAYLYDLEHFHELEEKLEKEGSSSSSDPDANPLLPPVPQEFKDITLVVDAARQGNVARFINHSCEPNCLTQAMFARGARSHLLHYVAVVAAQNIPALTEFTYDYQWDKEVRVGGLWACC